MTKLCLVVVLFPLFLKSAKLSGLNKTRIWLRTIQSWQDSYLLSLKINQSTNLPCPKSYCCRTEQPQVPQTQQAHHFRKDQFLAVGTERMSREGSSDLSSMLIGSNTRSCKRGPQIRNCKLLPQFICPWKLNVLLSLQCCRQGDRFQNMMTDSKIESQTIKETVGLIRWLNTTTHGIVFLVKWVVMNKGYWFSLSKRFVLCWSPA